jgi:hypothetical protein
MKDIKILGGIDMIIVLGYILGAIVLIKLGLTIVQICMVYAAYLLIDKWISTKRA